MNQQIWYFINNAQAKGRGKMKVFQSVKILRYPPKGVFPKRLCITTSPEEMREGFCSFFTNEQLSTCFNPILNKKSLVAILLCRSLNRKTLSFLSLVHRKGNRYAFSQLLVTAEIPIASP